MNAETLNEIIERRTEEIRRTLKSKGEEYATDKDRLQNFTDGAALLGCNRSQALLGYMTKHLVSVIQMVRSGKSYPKSVWDEKIGDAINYHVLLEGTIQEDGLIAVPHLGPGESGYALDATPDGAHEKK